MRKVAPQDAQSSLAEALGRYRTALLGVFVFSALINLLMLTGPLFMLQVYDRVLPSRSIPTLVGLAVLAAALFSFQGLLDATRGRVLHRIGGSISEDLVGRAYNAVLRLPLVSRGGGDGLQPVRDLDKIQHFLASPGPGALFDLPWMPFYVAICFLFHPYIGIAAAVGADDSHHAHVHRRVCDPRADALRGRARGQAQRLVGVEPPQR